MVENEGKSLPALGIGNLRFTIGDYFSMRLGGGKGRDYVPCLVGWVLTIWLKIG
jgi:hypothetical protein